MQPTHARWEQIHELPDNLDQAINGASNDHLTNGDSVHGMSNGSSHEQAQQQNNLFKPVPDIVSRNMLVTDVYYETPRIPNPGVPGPDGGVSDLGPNGLSTIDQDLLDELPEDCRQAFEEARAAEVAWKSKWTTEQNNGSRGKLRIGFNGFPV